MRGRLGAVGLLLLLGTLACCSRSVGADEECRGPDLLTDPINGADAVLGDGTCSFEDEQGEYQHRIICDTESCRWYVDETLCCTCQQLDFANTCANGVPTCADWHSSFDFSLP